jgi:hypothetical protein
MLKTKRKRKKKIPAAHPFGVAEQSSCGNTLCHLLSNIRLGSGSDIHCRVILKEKVELERIIRTNQSQIFDEPLSNLQI